MSEVKVRCSAYDFHVAGKIAYWKLRLSFLVSYLVITTTATCVVHMY